MTCSARARHTESRTFFNCRYAFIGLSTFEYRYMPLRIWCRSIIDGAPNDTVLPDLHEVGAAAANLKRLLKDVTATQPGWSVKGPFHEDGKFARWEVVDQRGVVTAAYRLVGPRDW